MTMKSTQMTTTTSIWKSSRRCKRRPLISKRTKMMMKESKNTMMTSSRRARGRKLAVRVVCRVAIETKRTVPAVRMGCQAGKACCLNFEFLGSWVGAGSASAILHQLRL